MSENLKKYLPGWGFIYFFLFCTVVVFFYLWLKPPVNFNRIPVASSKNPSQTSIVLQTSVVRIKEIFNFGQLEGPHAMWNLPKFQWGLGPGSTISLHSKEKLAGVLSLEICNHIHKQQKLEIFLNDKSIKTISLKMNIGKFLKIPVPIELKKGDNLLLFKYSRWMKKAKKRKLALIFSGIRIEQAIK